MDTLFRHIRKWIWKGLDAQSHSFALSLCVCVCARFSHSYLKNKRKANEFNVKLKRKKKWGKYFGWIISAIRLSNLVLRSGRVWPAYHSHSTIRVLDRVASTACCCFFLSLGFFFTQYFIFNSIHNEYIYHIIRYSFQGFIPILYSLSIYLSFSFFRSLYISHSLCDKSTT